jgi:hypothetical protein
MSQATFDERVTRLDQFVDQLLQAKSLSSPPGRDDWKRTFAMFVGDAVTKEIIQAGQRLREEERRQEGA